MNNRDNRQHNPAEKREIPKVSVEQALKRDIGPVVNKLNELRNGASADELTRINRVVKAMNDAMIRTERQGAHAGKYKQSVDGDGSTPAYEQHEGIPVDEAISILRAKEASLPANSPDRNQFSGLIANLEKNSVDYFKAHYGKSNADVASGAAPLSSDESKKQNLRVRTEAKLISKDPDRASKKTDPNDRLKEDYDHGQADLNVRKEWEYNPYETPVAVGLVDASHSAEVLAKMRAEAEMTKRMNTGSFLKKWWNRVFEEGKKQALYEEELNKISGKKKKHGWFAKNILRRKDEAHDEQNMFRDLHPTGKESKEELAALAKRFVDNNIQRSEGEQREEITNTEFNRDISRLVYEYATGNMSDVQFEEDKKQLVTRIKQQYPGHFKKDVLTADNFLEAARVFRKQYEHGVRLTETSVQLKVVLGEAKSRIKSEENLSWTNKLINKIEKNALGKYIKPATIGYASSALGYFIKKPLQTLGGAIGFSSAFAMFRKSKQVRQDIAMHRREREAGISVNTDAATAKRRHEVEAFVNKMEKASDLMQNIAQARAAFEQHSTPENRAVLLEHLANAEARMSLSATTKRGLIEYGGETSLERSSMGLMAEIAQGKVLAGVNDISQTAEYKNVLKTLNTDVKSKDKAAEKYRRWEVVKAGLVGGAIGVAAGIISQEATDEIGEQLISHFGHNQVWDWMDRPARTTPLEKIKDYIVSHTHAPKDGDWWNWLKSNYAGCEGGSHIGTALHSEKLAGHTINLDDSLKIEQDSCDPKLFHIVDSSSHQKLGDLDNVGGKLVPRGKLDPSLLWKVETLAGGGGGGTKTGDLWSTLTSNMPPEASDQNIHTVNWYDNPSLQEIAADAQSASHAHNLNELRFYVNREANGDLKLSVPVKDGDSFLFHYGQDPTDPASYRSSKISEAFADGKIKMIFVPEGSSPDHGIVLDVDPVTKQVILPHDSSLQKLWDPTTNKFKGDGYFGLAEQVGEAKDGNPNFIWINSDRGNGTDIDINLDSGDSTDSAGIEGYKLTRTVNDAQCGPTEWDPPMFVPFYSRNQLEVRDGGSSPSSPENAPAPGSPERAPVHHTPEQIASMTPEQRAVAADAEISDMIANNRKLTQESFNEIATRCHLTPEQKVEALRKGLTTLGVDYADKIKHLKEEHEKAHPGVPFEEEKELFKLFEEAQAKKIQAAPKPATANPAEGTTKTEIETEDNDDDEREETAKERELHAAEKLKLNAEVKAFNKNRENKNPHIEIKFDSSLAAKKSADVLELVKEIQEKLKEDGYRNQKYKDRNLIFEINPTGPNKPQRMGDGTEVLRFSVNQTVEAIAAVYTRALDGKLNYEDADGKADQAKATAAPKGDKTPDAAKAPADDKDKDKDAAAKPAAPAVPPPKPAAPGGPKPAAPSKPGH